MVGKSGKKDYCSTTEAAERLGLSLGTVQQMVENGVLEGWKTSGGHRRILLSSVDDFLGKSSSDSSGSLRVLIAEDDLTLHQIYRSAFESWRLPTSLELVSNGVDVLLDIGHGPPDLLITDLQMPGLDGFEMIRRIRERKLADTMDIIVVSGLDVQEIEAKGGLPEDVTFFAKPVPLREIHGYLLAMVARRRRR